MWYGRVGTLTAHPGDRDALVQILLRDVDALREIGCDLYIVKVSDERPDVVWVTEVWASAEAHRASLRLDSVRRAIADATPLLTGEFDSMEFEVMGGLGLTGAASHR